jgi:hypothetical protein
MRGSPLLAVGETYAFPFDLQLIHHLANDVVPLQTRSIPRAQISARSPLDIAPLLLPGTFWKYLNQSLSTPVSSALRVEKSETASSGLRDDLPSAQDASLPVKT